MLLQSTQNETADVGFFRTIGLAFILLTAMSGCVTLGLLLNQ